MNESPSLLPYIYFIFLRIPNIKQKIVFLCIIRTKCTKITSNMEVMCMTFLWRVIAVITEWITMKCGKGVHTKTMIENLLFI
jgi:hypothetical protein